MLQKLELRRCIVAVNAAPTNNSCARLEAADFFNSLSHEPTLALPKEVEHWSLTTRRIKLVKIRAKVIDNARYTVFQVAEVAVPRDMFRRILEPADGLRPNASGAMSMAMAAVEPDLHACRQLNCVQLVAKSAKMTMKGGKDGNVGGFGVQNAFSAFPGEINQAIMTLKLGRWAVHLENVAPMSRPKSRHGKEDA